MRNFAFQKIILVLFGIMPAFSFLNLWDSYLSATLYSGNTNNGIIYTSNEVKKKLPPPIQHYVRETAQHKNAISLLDWSLGELNVPPYPEIRIYKGITRNICRHAGFPSEVELVIEKKQTFFFHKRQQTIYNCADL